MDEIKKLPEGWYLSTLGIECKFTQGIQVDVGLQSFEKNNKVRFLRIIDFTQTNEPPRYIDFPGERYLLKKDEIAMVRYGTVGFVCTGKEGVIANNLFKVNPSANLTNRFLINFLNSHLFKANLKTKGATMQALSFGLINPIKIPIPPLPTQQAIVSKIEELFSELDKGIENLKTAQAQLKVYRQSVLKWAFEGKLTEEWRNRQVNISGSVALLNQIQQLKEKEAKSINKKLKPTNSLSDHQLEVLPELPKSWSWVSLGEVISDLTDYHANGSYVKIKENVQLLDVPDYAIMIRATNFEKENFKTDLKYITEHAYNFLSRSKLFGGEILIGKIGNAGRIYFMPNLKKPASLAMNLFALRFNIDVNKYIHYHLLSEFSKQEISNYVKGVGNPTIDKNSVRSLSIAMPSFEEQIQIVQEIESRFSVADKMEETIQQSLLQAESLRQSILKKAFVGELVK
jgi:type I restriction enzyme S subunit